MKEEDLIKTDFFDESEEFGAEFTDPDKTVVAPVEELRTSDQLTLSEPAQEDATLAELPLPPPPPPPEISLPMQNRSEK